MNRDPWLGVEHGRRIGEDEAAAGDIYRREQQRADHISDPYRHDQAELEGRAQYQRARARSSSPCLINRVLIYPTDAAMLFSGHFDRNDHKHFPFVIDMARREAAELLNLNHKTTIRFAALPPLRRPGYLR